MIRLPPTFGILLFVGLFFIAASMYPGGSQFNPNSTGFSWADNYWCNLLYEEAINGETNPARPFAIVGMGFLCGSLALFFYMFPKYYPLNKIWDRIIQISGVLSMLLAASISTEHHDIMTTLSSLSGLCTLVGILMSLYKNKLRGFMYTAFFCIILLGVNNYIYYSENYLYYLPIIQKITFAVILLWVIALNFSFLKRAPLPKN